jgi:hypothetical protein
MKPPTFRLTADGDEAWVLTASIDCPCCNGRGEVRESHGEDLPCDCPFEEVCPSILEAIDTGTAYIIEPAPEWVERVTAAFPRPA